MNTQKTGIALVAIGAVLYFTSMNEKPLTQSDIKAGDDISFKQLSKLMLGIGAGLLIINVITKNK